MGVFDDLGGATAKKAPPPTTDPATGLLLLDETVWGRMVNNYRMGLPKGETCHIPQLDPHFKWMPGYLNVWTGWMNEGKTEWVYQLLLLRALLAAKKSAIFSPENMAEEFIYDQLIHALTGQNPDKDWRNCLPFDRYQRARDFVREMFVVVYPPKGQGRTPQHLLELFEAAIAKRGVSHCLMDPWNKLDHSGAVGLGGTEGYLVNTLGQLTDWTVDTKQSLTINAHPRQLPEMKFGQPRPIPDSSHISGGQTWENMAHIVATYYRPYKHLGKNSDLFSDVAIYVHKVKSAKLVGVRGSIGMDSETPDVRITYEWEKGRYFINGVAPLDCEESEAAYLSDAELRERKDMRADTSKPAPAAATQPAPPPQAPFRSEASSFDEQQPVSDEFPENWHVNGRKIG